MYSIDRHTTSAVISSSLPVRVLSSSLILRRTRSGFYDGFPRLNLPTRNSIRGRGQLPTSVPTESEIRHFDQRLLEGLNKQQRTAVTAAFDRHCLVLAGAGCGKTASLIRRIAWCIHYHYSPSTILALTFTRKAAEEMAERLRGLLGTGPEVVLPLVTTFHGFGLRVLRESIDGVANAGRLGYGEAEPSLLSSAERLEMLTRLTDDRERRAIGGGLLELERMLASLAVHPARLSHLGEQRLAILRRIQNRLAAEKRRCNRWEFSDMIQLCLELLRRWDDVRYRYACRYRYILVDEFQDTNPLQVSLLRELLSEGARVFAVGDDDQAIYGFRGADIGPILNFREHFRGASVLKLETNYRSTPSILRAANKIFRDKPQHLRKQLRAGKSGSGRRERGPRPRIRIFRDQDSMFEWIAETADSISTREKIEVAEMAVLFRLNETKEWFRRQLESVQDDHASLPRLMTVHGSKGLEFSVVFLCDLEEGVWPGSRRRKPARIRTWWDVVQRVISNSQPESDADLEEERRLFYVGVTRAVRRLFLLSARKKCLAGRTRRFEPSRFLRLV
ncbi:MAG: AAA family ATPase [Chitinivibrionales bacterium]|nr:AAA family ATPase [Chitinivibrionales bacterium]MBD3356646.1 AAA family ATPase [Chitinivibrionales bacterium]